MSSVYGSIRYAADVDILCLFLAEFMQTAANLAPVTGLSRWSTVTAAFAVLFNFLCPVYEHLNGCTRVCVLKQSSAVDR